MFQALLNNKKFIIGSLFITLLLIGSFLNMVFNDGKIRQVQAIYDDGALVDTAPFYPSQHFLFGTDQNGYDLLHVIVEGAKYTIGLTICIAIIQIIMGGILGALLSDYLSRVLKGFESFLETFSVIPITIIAYFILVNVLTMPIDGFAEPFIMRAGFEILILILLPINSIILYVSKETQKVLNSEFVQASLTLGASTLHLLVVHVLKHLKQKLLILFTQQLNQVLIILAHLGLLKMFFGGTVIDYSPIQDPPKTLSYEWSGLIGAYFKYLYIYPHIVFVPILFFALTIISTNLILKGATEAVEKKSEYLRSKTSKQKTTFISIEAKGF